MLTAVFTVVVCRTWVVGTFTSCIIYTKKRNRHYTWRWWYNETYSWWWYV